LGRGPTARGFPFAGRGLTGCLTQRFSRHEFQNSEL
jgi:hypothetical protein